MNKICNHLLGHLKDYDYIPLHFNSIKEDLQFYSHSTLLLTQDGYGEFVFPKQYLDKRFHMTVMFNYCPFCGEKINWRKIKQTIL